MDRHVEVSDQEIRIEFIPDTKCRANVTLRSLNATTAVAFKVQTSSPHKFLVNPPTGLIPPLSSATFQVILKPQPHLPHPFPRSPSDRFLIRTALPPPPPHHLTDDSITSWFNNSSPPTNTSDIKLRVAFVGKFLLTHAVQIGDCDSVRKLIKRQRLILSEFGTRDAESLYRVAESKEEMVSLLVENGLRVVGGSGLGPSKGWGELHLAAAFDRREEVGRLVREGEGGGGGVALDGRDKEGRTPLHLAASKGYVGCVKVLVGAGANVDARSKDGKTPLYRAAANGHRPIVQLLMDAGADPTVAEADLGRSPIDIARDKRHGEIVKILERGEEVARAARRGEVKLLESLLEKRASTSFSDQYGLTPLHISALKSHRDIIMLLAEYDADLDCQDTGGHTPLHLAVEGGCIQTIEVLVNRGADVNVKNKSGATPLHMARLLQGDDIAQILLDFGAVSFESLTSNDCNGRELKL